jgi:phage head maturation protease
MTTSLRRTTPANDVRAAILSQHEALRGMLAVTVELASQSPQSEQELAVLRGYARTLYETLAEHMSFEEEVLAAALRDVIGRGAEIQIEMLEDHDRQRVALVTALEELGPRGLRGPALADNVRAFASTLLEDMEREERGLLQADLDAIIVDDEDG